MFTRKHFEAIAEILRTERVGRPASHNITVDAISHRMVEFFERENPEFSRDKFLQACGLPAIPHIILVEHWPADRISFTVSTSGATGSHPHSSIATMKRYLRGLYSNATFEVLRKNV